jgi:nucleotide-binding universal stress UspA family protein
VDLLVIGTVRRTHLLGLLIGSTAERALSAVECSVLALKPDGFVSPVTLDR